MHDDLIAAEFSHQAESFNNATVANSAEILGELLRLADPQRDERWLDAGCGPGIVTRRLAPHVAEVVGIDATAAMVDVAQREAAAFSNARFAVGDATEMADGDSTWDGAISRFVIHHVPAPIRLVEEMTRVVRPGGKVVLADHVADDDVDGYAWSQGIERLRDPSHWATLAVSGLRALGQRAGLQLVAESLLATELDLDDWLVRGSGAAGNASLIDRSLAERRTGSRCFRLDAHPGRRTLGLRVWLSRWAVP